MVAQQTRKKTSRSASQNMTTGKGQPDQGAPNVLETPVVNAEPKKQKTVNDYIDLIETVARVEYSRLPNHLIDHSELVNIGAVAIHVLLTSNPGTEYNVTYLSTAIKWAVRNELRYRYKWYSLKQVSMDNSKEEAGSGGENAEASDAGDEFEVAKTQVREALYETILSVDSMMDSENPHEIKDNSLNPEECSELKEMAKLVRDAIAKLPERERQIIEARFYKNMKMREIGTTFNISASRISRIVQSGLDKIKLDLTRKGYVYSM